jgi:hypothetical protein
MNLTTQVLQQAAEKYIPFAAKIPGLTQKQEIKKQEQINRLETAKRILKAGKQGHATEAQIEAALEMKQNAKDKLARLSYDNKNQPYKEMVKCAKIVNHMLPGTSKIASKVATVSTITNYVEYAKQVSLKECILGGVRISAPLVLPLAPIELKIAIVAAGLTATAAIQYNNESSILEKMKDGAKIAKPVIYPFIPDEAKLGIEIAVLAGAIIKDGYNYMKWTITAPEAKTS